MNRNVLVSGTAIVQRAAGSLSAIALASTLALACGGSSTPPPAPPPAPAPSATEAANKDAIQPGPRIEGAAATASGDDVKNGIAALKAGDMNGARASFEVAIQKNPRQADAHHYLGVVLDQTGDKAGAEKNYREALKIQPDLEEAQTNLSAILVENGKFDEAAALMKQAIQKNPKNAALHVNLAMALSGKNDVEGANKAFEQASKLEPNNGLYLVTYAGHLVRNSKKDEAIAKLKQAEKLSVNDAGVLASIALEYKGMKDFKTCVAVLDKAVHVKDVAELRVYRGTCKLGLKDLSGATTEFKDAVAKDPKSALAHYSLGNALADGGKLDDAIAEWEAFIKLAPDGAQAKMAQAKIEKAKKLKGSAKK